MDAGVRCRVCVAGGRLVMARSPLRSETRDRLLWLADTVGHKIGADRLPWFWRICDAYDLSLGAPDTPANFPRRWAKLAPEALAEERIPAPLNKEKETP